MMTGERVGVGHDPSRGAAYVEGWIAALEEDPREIRRAAADAQKISDFVLSRSRDPRARAGADRPSRAAAPRAAADLRAAPLTVGEEPGDVRPHGRTGPADRRATKPQSLPHAGRPPPRIRREPGPRVHLLPRTVRARAGVKIGDDHRTNNFATWDTGVSLSNAPIGTLTCLPLPQLEFL